jgi:hypothetical protein
MRYSIFANPKNQPGTNTAFNISRVKHFVVAESQKRPTSLRKTSKLLPADLNPAKLPLPPKRPCAAPPGFLPALPSVRATTPFGLGG